MPLTSLIFKNTYDNEFRTSGKKEIIFSFDSILSESHSSSATITEREVEATQGQQSNTINDHLVLAPETVTLTAMITETPITLASLLVGGALGFAVGNNTNFGANLAAGVLGGLAISALSTTEFDNGNTLESGTRTTNAYEILQGMQKSRLVFDMLTGLKLYKSMMIESISVDKNADLGKDAQFTATLKKVNIVTSELVAVDPSLLKEDVSSKGQPEKNLGDQPSNLASVKTSENASIAYTLFN